jgi:hypothetical protein
MLLELFVRSLQLSLKLLSQLLSQLIDGFLVVLAQLIHLASLFDEFSSQLVFNDGILHDLLPQLIQDFSEVASA